MMMIGTINQLLGENRVKFMKSHPRESGFFIWLILVILLQLKQKFSVSKDQKKHSISFRGNKFTETKGGYSDVSWTGTIEYWMITLVRTVECYGMYKSGENFFTKKHNGRGSIERLKALLWAAFSLLPVVDLIVPEDWSNPKETENRSHLDTKFRLPLYWWTFLELYSTIIGIGAVSNPKSTLTGGEKAAVLGMLALFNGGVGINTSHELLHKKSILEKCLGYLLLVNVNYVHWGEEHLTGHHKNVATPNDPASSRMNESFYEFYPRTLIGSWNSAVQIEMNRLKATGQSKWNPVQNRVFWYVGAPIAWASFIAKVTGGGMRAIQYFFVQGLGAATLLELVNYIEHYGLSRDKLPDGRYEPVNPTHSWNAPHRISNTLLYKLQRHSDHHTYALREYQYLRNFEESPQLPNGYPGMILMALFPPIYFHIMNPLVKAAKVKPENYQEHGFQKDKDWIEAENTAKIKTGIFSFSWFVIGTYLLSRK